MYGTSAQYTGTHFVRNNLTDRHITHYRLLLLPHTNALTLLLTYVLHLLTHSTRIHSHPLTIASLLLSSQYRPALHTRPTTSCLQADYCLPAVDPEMARSVSRPTSHNRRPSTLPALSPSRNILLSCLTLLLLSYHPPLTTAQLSSIPFLSDQPRHHITLSPNHTQFGLAWYTHSLNVEYAGKLTIVTSNASLFYATLAIDEYRYDTAGTAGPDNVTALLLGQSASHQTDFSGECAALDVNSTGLCNVTLVMADQIGATVFYSLYTATTLQYNTAYTNTATAGSLTYYARYVQSNDLDVLFDLSWFDPSGSGRQLPLYTVMLVASERALFTVLNPSNVGNVSVGSGGHPYSEQWFVLSPSMAGFTAGVYLIGLLCTSNSYPTSSLTVTSNYHDSTDTATTTGYTTVLSVMALILSCSVAAIIMFRVCILCRRRRSQLIVLSRAEVAVLDPPHTTAPPLALYNGAVYRPPQQLGATEAEIASLPEMLYVRSAGSEGDEADDPRCTICLDEYESTVSHITTLHCGHSFHSTCVHSWLRQRRYCPLCLQIIDRAHDVKKERRHSTTTRDIELLDMSSAAYSRPATAASFSRPTTAASDAAIGDSMSRPTTDASGALIRHWDDEEMASRAGTDDGRTSSRASMTSVDTAILVSHSVHL